MPKPIGAIDHLLTYVHELEGAASLFRRMGFTLSPVSHIAPMGISNHLVLMTPVANGFANFIELMAVQDQTKLPAPMAKILSGPQAVKSMVLGAADINTAHAAILKQGFEASPPVHVKREWIIGPSESVFPEFDVILPFPAPLPFNCCRYFNVDLYLRPEWLVHANTAKGIRAVLAVAKEPVALLKTFAAMFDEPLTEDGDRAHVVSGGIELVVLSSDAAWKKFGVDRKSAGEVGYLGYVIEVESLDALQSSLSAGGIAYRRDGASIYIDPAVGLGNLMIFREKSGF
ncbi:VOC family protein [Pseudorhodoplanes sinuspersici]|uniref:Uncharacterized protein n=1 Tax=Pseudorhodoplanes sinuspersici TaxID=1235591 RepID=A0A1W6ZUI6_9HYPH|nr:VOC family protein [Pseudorhodoplanes sinuspersici]ARQ01002.1 hypothetical protein CAK95_19300 [Pseudorhodoplanes sinuspersici]RKE72639.1 glyoxalase-like protein [Pseudorhodoplanes sinuspersici]